MKRTLDASIFRVIRGAVRLRDTENRKITKGKTCEPIAPWKDLWSLFHHVDKDMEI
jgi:hypothetical protein